MSSADTKAIGIARAAHAATGLLAQRQAATVAKLVEIIGQERARTFPFQSDEFKAGCAETVTRIEQALGAQFIPEYVSQWNANPLAVMLMLAWPQKPKRGALGGRNGGGGGGGNGYSFTTSGDGTVSVTSAQQISAQANPHPGASFVGWTLNGHDAGSDNPLLLPLEGHGTVVAIFD